MRLKKYQEKRVFKETPEPNVRKKAVKTIKELEFCVQKHAATRLHYDFRLEHKGVLLSWAIPKGPSVNPSDKRLAIQVEDHPFEYRNFEGVIPKGNYGAGTVEIWDKGTYSVPGANTRQESEKLITAGLEKGHVEVELHGKKLNGIFDLVKIKSEKDNTWLFIKKRDDHASQKDVIEPKADIKLPKKKMPREIKPMLATLVKDAFDDPEWLFEVKWDGYRTLAYIEKNKVELFSRNQNLFNPLFPSLVKDLLQFKGEAILDGEVVILDKEGRSHFQLMQNYQTTQKGALYYYVFDLLYFEGRDLRSLPLIERKKLLEEFLKKENFAHVRFSDHVLKKGKSLYQEAAKKQLEGIIGKKIQSTYSSSRSREWMKVKTHSRQEAVICGFTAPRGSRKKFGALVLGIYEGKDLIYVGHTGGGFDAKLLEQVHAEMEPHIQQKCPFEKVPKPNAPVTWLKPKLVCEISFTQWTREGIARNPIFEGLRMDKKPKEVKREMPEVESKKEANEGQFSNLDKIYWPKEKYTKKDLINYYQEVSPYMLPYLKNRPVMLRRFPNGIEGESFYQKDMSNFKIPPEMETVSIHQENGDMQYILIQDLHTLEYVANLGAIEIHPFLSQAGSLEEPDYLLIDLDPVEIPFNKVVETALEVHSVLNELKVKNYCKTSGGKGLHIFTPLQKKYDFQQAKQFGQIIATIVHERIPKFTSLERKPANRQKKVYLDVYQNNFGQTSIATYGVRARPGAPVSTPLEWDEVKKGLDPREFTIKTVPARLKKMKDIFKPVLGKGVNLESVLKKLESSM